MREVKKRQPSLAQGARVSDSGGGGKRGKGCGVRERMGEERERTVWRVRMAVRCFKGAEVESEKGKWVEEKERRTDDVAVNDLPLIYSVSPAPPHFASFNIDGHQIVGHLLRIRVRPEGEEHIGNEGLLPSEGNWRGRLLLHEARREVSGSEGAGTEPGKARVEVDVCPVRRKLVRTRRGRDGQERGTDQSSRTSTADARDG